MTFSETIAHVKEINTNESSAAVALAPDIEVNEIDQESDNAPKKQVNRTINIQPSTSNVQQQHHSSQNRNHHNPRDSNRRNTNYGRGGRGRGRVGRGRGRDGWGRGRDGYHNHYSSTVEGTRRNHYSHFNNEESRNSQHDNSDHNHHSSTVGDQNSSPLTTVQL